jgi:hypothetical protein
MNDKILQSILKPGINHVSNAEYHKDSAYLSSSVFKTILKSLDAYKDEYIDGNRKEHSPQTMANFAVGSLLHSMVLEPELVAVEYEFFPGWRKAGHEFEEFKANAKPGLPIISLPQLEKAKAMYESYKRNPVAVDLIKNGFPEYTLATVLAGVPVKVRADWISLTGNYICDVKSTSGGSDIESVKETVKAFQYDLSGALYSWAYEVHYGRPFDFYLLMCSKLDNNCAVYKIGEETMARGRAAILFAINKYKRAVETGIWTEGAAQASPVQHDILEI